MKTKGIEPKSFLLGLILGMCLFFALLRVGVAPIWSDLPVWLDLPEIAAYGFCVIGMLWLVARTIRKEDAVRPGDAV